jgi:pyridoxine 5-phosphate synthase
MRLYINIDHVATIRQARRTDEPDPVLAAHAAVEAGAHGITAHLREDRRHIQDHDVERLAAELDVPFNLEMACTNEMIEIARRLKPHQVTFVPERREEITTEGGLDVRHHPEALKRGCEQLAAEGIRVSLFIAPNADAVNASHEIGVPAIELHTGAYAHHPGAGAELEELRRSAALGKRLGLAVHAGHGLTVRNVGPVAAIQDIEELNIGHSIVSMSIFTGIADAVRAMKEAIDTSRRVQTR